MITGKTPQYLNHDNPQTQHCRLEKRKGMRLSTNSQGSIPSKIHQQQATKASFEFATWELRAKNNTITIHSIYHPPYSTTNRITNAKFIEEFTDHVSSCLPTHQNNIFIGDLQLTHK